MKRRKSIQIITPKMPKPATRWPLTRSADMPNDLDDLDDQREQHRAADDERHEDGAARPQHLAEREIEHAARRVEERHAAEGSDSCAAGVAGHCFTRYLKTACRLSSGDCTSSICPASPRRRQLGQPRIESVGPRRLDDHRVLLELHAEHIVFGEEPARQRARIRAAHVDRVRMRVDQIANLVDVAFGDDAAVVDQAGCSRSSTRSRAGCGSRR